MRSTGSASADGGELLWKPTPERAQSSNVARYLRWLAEGPDLTFSSYEELWEWSVADVDAFWGSIVAFFDADVTGAPGPILANRDMPGAAWFPGRRTNYARRALGRGDDHHALVFRSETGAQSSLTYSELRRLTARAAAGLRQLGVARGDRVVAYLPNLPEAVIAFLACASIGAIWSSCAPEFGPRSVVDRFAQVAPRVLLAGEGYVYAGEFHDRSAAVQEIRKALTTVTSAVSVPYPGVASRRAEGCLAWSDFLGSEEELTIDDVPFDHPLWILFSSGTTGPPKPIVQGHGGILLEHLKALSLHLDLREGDRFFWFTTTGWMMWNLLISGLLVGCTVVLYDGSPRWPDLRALWTLADDTGVTYFGTSAPYLAACMKADMRVREEFDLNRLRSIGSTASPLSAEVFRWVYRHVANDVLLGSISGGTDVCTSLVMSSPLLPVHAGELQCRALGADVHAFDGAGQALIGEVGELVVTKPMPSMPLFFWGDQGFAEYKHAYFDVYPGVWRHGDWINISQRGTCVISGRSDATLNRGGVRMGTSEFYRVVEALPFVDDSLAVEMGAPQSRLLLFVVVGHGEQASEVTMRLIRETVRRELSPRHVPDAIYEITEVPRTLNGKKLEVPVKRILSGVPPNAAVSRGAVANPQSLDFFARLAGVLSAGS